MKLMAGKFEGAPAFPAKLKTETKPGVETGADEILRIALQVAETAEKLSVHAQQTLSSLMQDTIHVAQDPQQTGPAEAARPYFFNEVRARLWKALNHMDEVADCLRRTDV